MLGIRVANFVCKRTFFTEVAVFGKGKPTKDPFTTEVTPTNLGEDSYFVSSNKQFLLFGVADGVGGWTLEKSGAPDLVAQHFMNYCKEVAKEYSGEYCRPSPFLSQVVFSQAYERLQNNPPGLGSTTASICVCDNHII